MKESKNATATVSCPNRGNGRASRDRDLDVRPRGGAASAIRSHEAGPRRIERSRSSESSGSAEERDRRSRIVDLHRVRLHEAGRSADGAREIRAARREVTARLSSDATSAEVAPRRRRDGAQMHHGRSWSCGSASPKRAQTRAGGVSVVRTPPTIRAARGARFGEVEVCSRARGGDVLLHVEAQTRSRAIATR